MRQFAWIPLFICLTPIPVRADDATEARAVVDKAIKAVGGADALKKHPGITWKGSGTFYYEGDRNGGFTDEHWILGRDKFHWDMKMLLPGTTIPATLVLDGAKGWAVAYGARLDERLFENGLLPLYINELHILRTVDLLLPLKEKEFTLRPLGEIKVDDKPAVGIKAISKTLAEFDLYFDKETCLPVRCDFTVKHRDPAFAVPHSYAFSDYKEIDGRKHFTKLVLKSKDKLIMVMDRSDIKLVDKLDETLFAKP